MKTNRPFFKADTTAVFQVFQVSRFVLLLLVSVILARIIEEKAILAHYEKLLLVSASITFFWVTGLFNGLIPLYKTATTGQQDAYLRMAFQTGTLFAICSALLFAAITGAFFPEVPANASLQYSIFILLNTSSFLLEYYLLLESKRLALVIFGICFYSAYMLALVIPVWNGQTLASAIQVLSIVAGAKFVLQAVVLSGRIFRKSDTAGLARKLWNASYPLGIATLIGGAAGYLNSLIAGGYFSNEHFVIYQYGARELPLVMLVAGALSAVKSGEIAESLQQGRVAEKLRELKRGSLRLMHFFFPVSIVMIASGDWIFETVFGESFRESVPIFDIFMVLIIPRMLFPQSVLRGHLRTRELMYASAAELFLSLGLSLVFLHVLGLEGIALAALLAFCAERIVLLIHCKRRLGIALKEYTAVRVWVAYSILVLVVFLIKSWPVSDWLGVHMPIK